MWVRRIHALHISALHIVSWLSRLVKRTHSKALLNSCMQVENAAKYSTREVFPAPDNHVGVLEEGITSSDLVPVKPSRAPFRVNTNAM